MKIAANWSVNMNDYPFLSYKYTMDRFLGKCDQYSYKNQIILFRWGPEFLRFRLAKKLDVKAYIDICNKELGV